MAIILNLKTALIAFAESPSPDGDMEMCRFIVFMQPLASALVSVFLDGTRNV